MNYQQGQRIKVTFEGTVTGIKPNGHPEDVLLDTGFTHYLPDDSAYTIEVIRPGVRPNQVWKTPDGKRHLVVANKYWPDGGVLLPSSFSPRTFFEHHPGAVLELDA